MAKRNGYQAMITQHSWMFLSSFEKLRTKLLSVDIVNMAHLGARAFEEIGGEVVQTTSFVFRKSHITDYKGEYCRLIEPTSQQGKEDMFLSGENRYEADQSNFSKIPGSPVAYWVSANTIRAFENGKTLGSIASVPKGLSTGSVDNFMSLRLQILLSPHLTVTKQLKEQSGILMRKAGHTENGTEILSTSSTGNTMVLQLSTFLMKRESNALARKIQHIILKSA